MLFFLTLILLLQPVDIPLKAKGEFSVTVDFQFKSKPGSNGSGSNTKIRINDYNTRPQGTLSGVKAPHIRLKLLLQKLSALEVKAKITDESGTVVYNKKVKEGVEILLNVGFVDEMKERLVNTQFDCILYSLKKEPVSKIEIVIAQDGTYTVNGVRLGKF